MSQFYCPLCKQEVSKSLYEKITGVWQEKEKRLASLKIKEKQLLQKEKQMQVKFDQEKKRIAATEQAKLKKGLIAQENKFRVEIKKQKEAVKNEKEAVMKAFEKKLATETNRVLREERARQKQLEKTLKDKFEQSAKEKLSKERKRIEKDTKSLQKREKIQLDKNRKLNIQFISFQTKSKAALEKQETKIKSLEEQLQKDKTPQVLGLLEETVFLQKLKLMFHGDKFEHTGKGGDIVHNIIEKGNSVGIIVYELKKVSAFSKKHIEQTFKAKQQRSADYGILVTNAKRTKDDFGFGVTKGVIIIHPAGSLVLVGILRDHIVRISKLQLSAQKRNETVQAVLEYIQSPSFRNGIETIIEDTKDLYISLTKEVKDHVRTWELRFGKYRNIHRGAYKIEAKAVNLLSDDGKRKRITEEGEIVPIALPSKID